MSKTSKRKEYRMKEGRKEGWFGLISRRTDWVCFIHKTDLDQYNPRDRQQHVTDPTSDLTYFKYFTGKLHNDCGATCFDRRFPQNRRQESWTVQFQFTSDDNL